VLPTSRALWALGLVSVTFVAGLGGAHGMAILGAVLDLVVLGLVLFDGLQASRVPLAVHRSLPGRVHQHEDAEIGLHVANPSDRKLRVLLRDTVHPTLLTDAHTHTIDLPRGVRVDRTLRVRPLRRGTMPLGDVHLRVPGPLGLALHQRTVSLSDSVRVLPQARLDGDDGLQLARLLRSPQGAHHTRRFGRSHALAHLREYARGDSRRSIHWRASARRHRPVTRVTRRSDHQRVVLLVDAGRTMTAATDTRSRLDRMLAAVLGFARVAIRLRDSVTIVVYGAQLRKTVHIDPRTRRFAPAFDALHDLEARTEESAPGVAAAWVREHAPKGATVIWCTSVTDSAGTERLSAAARSMARRHPTVLLNLLDADLHRIARQDPTHLVEAYEKASALQRRARLDALARSLTSAGVAVVQAPADRLVIGLVGRM